MNRLLHRLSQGETLTLAAVRLATTAHLVAIAAGSVGELQAKALARPFALVLSAPGLPRAGLSSRGGRVRAWSGGLPKPSEAGAASLVLRFPSARAAARALGGGGGMPLPIPLGPGAFAAIAFFRVAAARIPALLRDPGTDAGLRAALLAQAALQGLAAVAALDEGIEERLAHVPDGSVAVDAPGSFSIGLVKQGRKIAILDASPPSPNARLAFRDAEAAVAVLSGKRPAVVALGAGEVTIRGFLPLVQGLFAILDRLGEYLAVEAKGGRR
jgi:hypothetical protein